METLYSVNLMPIEPILFGDNRSARAGDDHLIRDQDPSPHTIFGAIGASIINMFGAKNTKPQWNAVKDFLGEFEPDISSGSENRSELLGYHFLNTNGDRLFPMPQHIRLTAPDGGTPKIGESMLLKKLQTELTACSLRDFTDFLSFAPDEHEEEINIQINENLLEKLLCGRDCKGMMLKPAENNFPIEQLYKGEVRRGLGMNYEKNSTREGILFSRPYRRFFSNIYLDTGEWRSVSIQAYFKTLKSLESDAISKKQLAFLGGDRGRAFISFTPLDVDKPLAAMRQAVQNSVTDTSGFFTYFLTPAVRQENWPCTAGLEPIAAAIGKSTCISGWNTDPNNQHPRPILRLIPAGSTFFYPWPTNYSDDAKRNLIEENWLEPVTKGSTEDFRNSGFGRILIGVWKDEN